MQVANTLNKLAI